MSSQTEANLFSYEFKNTTLFLKGSLILKNVDKDLSKLHKEVKSFYEPDLIIDLKDLSRIDSSGVMALQLITNTASENNVSVTLQNVSQAVQKNIELFTLKNKEVAPDQKKVTFFESIGLHTESFFKNTLRDFIVLSADVFYWSFSDLVKSKARRKGEFINQAVLIGANALLIVGVMSFLIGLVLALQSAAQLRQFGANIFIVDLTVIAMTREMGPLITAIIVAGRSGSAIASEIATMKVTEELDALTTMALNPIRFVVVPKMQASILTLPLLSVMATFFGIMGGMLVAYLYLDITPMVFFSRMGEALYFRDIITGIIKSLSFAVVIVLTGSFFGYRVEQGAEGVGKVTTSSVVVAISLVIVCDSILGLVFY